MVYKINVIWNIIYGGHIIIAGGVVVNNITKIIKLSELLLSPVAPSLVLPLLTIVLVSLKIPGTGATLCTPCCD